jgi:hypothetical protein
VGEERRMLTQVVVLTLRLLYLTRVGCNRLSAVIGIGLVFF